MSDSTDIRSCFVGITMILLATMSVVGAALLAVPILSVVTVSVVEIRGTTLGHTSARWLRWTWGQARGHTTYRAPTVLDHPGASDLPGVLAPGRFHRRVTLLSAAMLSTWSYGFAVIDAATALAEAGFTPPRRYVTVLDELWRALR